MSVEAVCEHRSWPAAELEELAAELERRAEAVLVALGSDARELAVLLCDDPRIRELNLQWRDEDKATDVLSFGADDAEELALPPGMEPPLGDIAISLDTAARQAETHGWDLLDEATFLLIHGICHLLGHDHAEPAEAAAMKAEEIRLLAVAAPGQARPPTPYG